MKKRTLQNKIIIEGDVIKLKHGRTTRNGIPFTEMRVKNISNTPSPNNPGGFEKTTHVNVRVYGEVSEKIERMRLLVGDRDNCGTFVRVEGMLHRDIKHLPNGDTLDYTYVTPLKIQVLYDEDFEETPEYDDEDTIDVEIEEIELAQRARD